MTLKEAVINSPLLPKANCILRTLDQMGVKELSDLDNLPRRIGKICGEDVYQVVAQLRQIWNSKI